VEGESQGAPLLRVLEKLLGELPDPEVEIFGAESNFAGGQTGMGNLSAEDEASVRGIRSALATLAVALDPRHDPPPATVRTVLDGAETVIRGELVAGRGDRLPRLLPSLVFLVALPIVQQDRALALSRRTAELIAAGP
jgi:hypothetical protein